MNAFTQKIDRQPLECDYIRMPLKPLPENIINYTSSIILDYEQEIIDRKNHAEEDCFHRR